MSKLSTKQRKALDLADFGDPARRLFPILDQDDVDSAAHLIGKAANPEAVKKRIIAIAKRKGLKIPDAWQEKAAMSMVHLAALSLDGESQTGDDLVVRTGLICRAGDYPNHDWSLTPDDLRAAAEAYQGGGYVELEHLTSQGKQTILDGQLGELQGVWASEDGTELYGDVALPAWIDRISAGAGHKVSAVWERATKALKGVGLVLDPAVPDAALMSAHVAFAKRHDTPQGQYAMQELHDVAARHGAVCSAGNTTMASKHEAGAIQAMHDLATDHGAKCAAVGARGPMLYSREGHPVAGEKTVAELQAQLEAEKAQRETDRKALVALQAERRVEKAESFVDKLITENRVLPAERDLLVKLHVQAATDDDTHGLVLLADGKQETRLATVVAALSARQVIGLTREQIAANPQVTVLLNQQRTREVTEQQAEQTAASHDNLLALTDLGRRALAAKRAAAK